MEEEACRGVEIEPCASCPDTRCKLPRHEMHAIEACARWRVLSDKPWGGRRRKGCVPRSNVGRLQEQVRQSKTGTGDATVSPCMAGSARYPEDESRDKISQRPITHLSRTYHQHKYCRHDVTCEEATAERMTTPPPTSASLHTSRRLQTRPPTQDGTMPDH